MKIISAISAALLASLALAKKKADTKDTTRLMYSTMITLVGVQGDELTFDETMFFEDMCKDAYNDAHAVEDDAVSKSVIVVDQNSYRDEGRALRTSASIWQKFYFSIYLFFEIACGPSCGDPCFERQLKKGEASPDSDPRLESDGRQLKKGEAAPNSDLKFENALCALLRAGPFEIFQDLEDCKVLYTLV
jgi:hypothetical protein